MRVRWVFPYRRVLTARGFRWIPILPVDLRHGTSSWLRADMVVDTGADLSLVSRSIGQVLGMKPAPRERRDELNGVGGPVEFVERKPVVRWRQQQLNIPVAWAFVDDVPCLLGRHGFLDRFEVCFDGRRKQFKMITG